MPSKPIVQVCCPPDVEAALRERARIEERSISQTAVRILRAELIPRDEEGSTPTHAGAATSVAA